ncbi:MAG TPA: efflux RND transporter permease subunit [Saprospiraceae bacterium]|nr:efflux RND transporter permease subunit [Saprospiraceae bacterium]HRV87069.1 efflux RND transporter permease subunit [Saprospiraceae bacterium]
MNFNKFFVQNYQFTLILFLAVLLLGINSLFNMPRSEDPPFNAPMFSIISIYPGTSPADMEELVADPIEEELYKLEDIKKITSTINDGLLVMLVEFNYGVNVDTKNNDVIREINKLRDDLPDGIIRLDVNRAASSDVAILQTALMSETASMETLNNHAEQLEKDLERIKDIKYVKIQGVPDRTVKIELDLERMASLGLGLNQVIGLIQANNINIPGGDIDLGDRKYNIKTTAEIKDLEVLKNTVVRTTPTGAITHLSDLANVYLTDEENDHIARLNGHRAIWIVTAMKDERNIVSTRAQIQTVLDQFSQSLPDDIRMEQAFDQEAGVRKRLDGLGRDFAIAIFLVLLTLLPLGTRASLVVMISIPLSLSIGLFLLDLLGYTLNQLSIVGMVIALGLLVDDSIVVVENIERYMRGGISAKEAAVSATNHILVAILGCTATLLLAFLPLANLPEGSGDFIRSLPMAVMLTVLASLFVSLTIIPFLSSVFLKAHEQTSHQQGNIFFRAFKQYVNNPYQRLLGWCVKHPVIALLGAAAIFGSSFLIIPRLGFSLFPASEKPIIIVDVETEPGSNLMHTDRVVRKIEQKLLQQPEVARLASNTGMGNPRIYYNEFQKQSSDNTGQLIVFMDDHTEVPEIEHFADVLREELTGYAGAKVEVRRFQQGQPISAPIEMRIIGDNLDTLEALSARVEQLMRHMKGSLYVKNDLKYQKTELKINIDRDKAGLYGLTSAEIAKTIRLAIAGLDIGEIRTAESDEYTLNASIRQNSENALENFDRIYVTSLGGSLVPLKSIAQITMSPSPPVIRHFNKERYSLVSSFVQTGYNTDQMTDAIIDRIQTEVPFPESYRLVAAGERESREESFGGIETIIILTVFGLLAILVLEFRTFKSTLIVLSVIPMGFIGAIVALWVTGETLSFVATVGIIALAGIEIKNSILMVDYTNSLREKGMKLYDAVMDGAETRFLPILLTSMTAIGGMTPLVLERSPLISPLAIVLIGGLISSTLLSRLVTPVLYYLVPPKVDVQNQDVQAKE